MSQKGLIYSFVAKGTVVLAEHTPYSGNFSTIAVQCLQKLPSNSSKYTYSCDGHTFNFLLDSGFGIASSFRLLCFQYVYQYDVSSLGCMFYLAVQFFLLWRMNPLGGVCRLCFSRG